MESAIPRQAVRAHGILAPAATGVGETLALFERRLPAEEQPELIDIATWDGLPADPRPERSRLDTTLGGAPKGPATAPGTKRSANPLPPRR